MWVSTMGDGGGSVECVMGMSVVGPKAACENPDLTEELPVLVWRALLKRRGVGESAVRIVVAVHV